MGDARQKKAFCSPNSLFLNQRFADGGGLHRAGRTAYTAYRGKAEANVHSKSLRTFIEKNPDLKGVRFSTLPYKDQDWMEYVPLYNVEKLIKDNNQ